MKRLLMLLLLLISISTVNVHATRIDSIEYSLDSESRQCSVVSSRDYEGLKEIIIPDSVFYEGIWYSVTSIDDRAFNFCEDHISISIPNNVTSIDRFAFVGSPGLLSIIVSDGNKVYDSRNNCNAIIETKTNKLLFGFNTTIIPDGVKSIGDYAFFDREGLTSISIPSSVTSIGDRAFNGCNELTSISISDNVNSIGKLAFAYCSVLTSISFPNNMDSIGEMAFSSCTGLTSITIPDNVTSIGYEAFGDCSELSSIVVSEGNKVYDSRNNCNAIIETKTNTLISGFKNSTIPDDVKSIGDGAFSGCNGLTSIYIPNSVTSIGENAFSGCYGLTSIAIPNGVTKIGQRAFYWCDELTFLSIPNSLQSIGDEAFSYCEELTSITIPDNVKSIGICAFEGSNKLSSIVVSDGNKVYDSRNNCNAIIETKTNKLRFGFNTTIIPDDVTSIGDFAFFNCEGLTSISISSSVTSIGDRAFSYCRDLTSIDIPNSVTTISEQAFYDCDDLNSISIPSSVTSIANSAFIYCVSIRCCTFGCNGNIIAERIPLDKVKKITLTEDVSDFSSIKFAESLDTLVSLSTTPPTISGFSDKQKENLIVQIPKGSKKRYLKTYGWKDIRHYVVVDNERLLK